MADVPNDLDLTNLIQKAQDLVHDGRLEGAAAATIPVQLVRIEGGNVYEICLTAKLKE